MPSNRETGFTLIEIVIALLMSGIIMGAIYTTSEKQQDVYVKQDQVIGMQDNLRSALMLLTNEIRLAGYDPTGNAGATITSATASSLTFTMDINGDGDTIDSGENLTYALYTDGNGISKLGRENPALNRAVAENIIQLEFYYTMNDGSQALTPVAPATAADIRAVEVTVLARTANTIDAASATTNLITPGAQSWPMVNSYLWRSESTMIQCRNMGL